jgi:Resolvase, N terminal domain
MKPAAIYARVSTDRQKEEHTIASQTEALRAFVSQRGFSVPDEWVFEDDGYMGATLLRPGLDKIRGLPAEGQIDTLAIDCGSPRAVAAGNMRSGMFCRSTMMLPEIPIRLIGTMKTKPTQR